MQVKFPPLHKKAVSYFIPNKMMEWNVDAETWNPTRSVIVNNLIKKEAEENDANILKYRIETEAAANSKLYTDQFVKLNLAKQLSNNTKFYFSGEQSSLGSLFSKILN